MKKTIKTCLLCWAVGLGLPLFAQEPPNTDAVTKKNSKEDDFYRMVTLPVPEGILLEVGGVATLPDGRIALATRRGDVWTVENPYMANGQQPRFTLFASGLHEAL